MSETTQTETIAGKLPPQNLDAEKSLLGAILIDEEVLADASEIVKPNDFYDKNHGLIFGGMMRLFEKHKPVDLLTLTDELKRKDELELIGGSAYLTDSFPFAISFISISGFDTTFKPDSFTASG